MAREISAPSQHCFRAARRHVARQRQENIILQLRLDLGHAKCSINELQNRMAYLQEELKSWQEWWNREFFGDAGGGDLLLDEFTCKSSDSVSVALVKAPAGLHKQVDCEGSAIWMMGAAGSQEDEPHLCEEHAEQADDAGQLFGGSFGRLDCDLRSCPRTYWEPLYDHFFNGYGDSGDVDSSSGGDEEPDLVVVWMTAAECKSMFYPNLDAYSFQHFHADGFRDYDAGVWYRIQGECDPSLEGLALKSCTLGHGFRRCPNTFWDSLYSSFRNASSQSVAEASNRVYWDKDRIMAFIAKLILLLQKEPLIERRREIMDEAWALAVDHIEPDMRDLVRGMFNTMPEEVTYNPDA